MEKELSEAPSGLAGSRTGIILTSAFFWAWFDMGTFRQALVVPFEWSHAFLGTSFIVTMAGGSLLLLVVMTRSRPLLRILSHQYVGALFCGCGIVGNMLSFAGAYFSNGAMLLLGSFVAGVACQFILLRWMSIYSYRGARSAGVCASGAIAAGVAIDILLLSLPALLSACLTILLIVPSLAVFLSADAHTAKDPSDGRGVVVEGDDSSERAGARLPLSSIFYNSRRLIFGLPPSLIIAFCVFGFSFGFMQCDIVFQPAALSASSSLLLLVARGVTAGIVFLATVCFPRRVYTVYKIGILIGLAGFVAMPIGGMIDSVNADSMNMLSGFVIAVGYATFDIITITLLAEIAFATGELPARLFSSGRFAVHASVLVGFLFTQFGFQMLSAELFFPITSSVIGYLLVIANMLLLNDSSALWMLIRYGRISSVQSGLRSLEGRPTGRPSLSALQQDLTERELEVLNLLLAGRSAPRISQILSISEHTVNSHVQHIYRKFGVHSRQSLLDLFDRGQD